MSDFSDRARTSHRRRVSGMSEAGRARLERANEAATDWRGQCSICKQNLVGSMAQLRGHVCVKGEFDG